MLDMRPFGSPHNGACGHRYCNDTGVQPATCVIMFWHSTGFTVRGLPMRRLSITKREIVQ